MKPDSTPIRRQAGLTFIINDPEKMRYWHIPYTLRGRVFQFIFCLNSFEFT